MSEAELTQLYKHEPNAKKKEKLLAVLHILFKGKTITEVAGIFFKSHNTIKSWRGRFLKHGPDGLDDKPRSGRPRKIENQTLDKFIKKADLVFPSSIAEDVTKDTGIECSPALVRDYLNSKNWSPKVPIPVYYNRDSVEDVIKWQRMMKRWIPRLEMDGFLFYVMDQSNMVLDHVAKSGPWAPKGERVFTRYYGGHRRIVVTLAISSSGQPVCWITDQFRTTEAVDFLKDLMKRGKIALVMDKAPVHRSRAVQKLIEENPDRLQVQYFPTGWPELNGAEHEWSVLKSHRLNFRRYETADARIDAIEDFCNTYHFDIDIKKVLFTKPVAKTF